MKSKNKNNGDDMSIHEQLCAFVLGELSEASAQEMEERLARSSELQAERARLEATIGLVTAHCSGSESLSLPKLDALEREAMESPATKALTSGRSYWGAPLQAAAGFIALATGLMAGKALMRDQKPVPAEGVQTESIARVERPEVLETPPPTADLDIEEQAVATPVAPGLPAESGSEHAELGIALSADKALAGKRAGGAHPVASPKSEQVVVLRAVSPESGTAGQANSVTNQVADGGIYHLATGKWERRFEADVPVAQENPTGGVKWPLGESRQAPTQSLGRSTTQLGQQDGVVTHTASNFVPPASTEPSTSFYGAEVKTRLYDGSGLREETLEDGGQRAALAIQGGQVAVGGAAPEQEALLGLSHSQWRLHLGESDRSDLDGSDDFFLGSGTRSQESLHRRAGIDIDTLCAQQSDRILRDCVRYPNESPSAMFFRFWGDNPFELARVDAKSTFSVDVDTASYTLARRYLNEGHLPQKAQVRTEEFVNYFSPDLVGPNEGTFAIHTELAPSRFGQGVDAQGTRWMLRVGLRAKDVAPTERKPLALTFVVDTSGSMRDGNRMELVKHALRLLVSQMNASDSIAIVGFNNSASLHLPMTSAQSRDVIEAAIYALNPDGGTNAEGGLRLGYEIAAESLTNQAHNRVVLLSDGVANIGEVDQDRINQDVRQRREAGIYLNTIGVGMGNHNDTFLEQLANKGDGLCNYVDSAAEARRALVDNFVGAFEAVARDVKVQVEFDPSQVYRYRLLGYENRAIADADFRNDAVDAGEVGAGHQVIALYELELTGDASEAPLAQVHLRWKAPTGPGRDPQEDGAQEMAVDLRQNAGAAWEGTSLGYRRSVLVAQFAEILRRSVHARGDSLEQLLADSRALAALEQRDDFDEFVQLVNQSRTLILQQAATQSDLSDCVDALRKNRILRAQLDEIRREDSKELLAKLERINADLEKRIRELVREELEGQRR